MLNPTYALSDSLNAKKRTVSANNHWDTCAPAAGYIVARPADLKIANQSTDCMQICVVFGCVFLASLKAFYLWTG